MLANFIRFNILLLQSGLITVQSRSPFINVGTIAIVSMTIVQSHGRIAESWHYMALTIDEYVIDVLMRDLIAHDRKPAAFIVYLYIWRETRSRNLDQVTLSHNSIADITGLSKSAVQRAISWLLKRKLLVVQKDSVTATPSYGVCSPWDRAGLH